jgi:hypothetical protein
VAAGANVRLVRRTWARWLGAWGEGQRANRNLDLDTCSSTGRVGSEWPCWTTEVGTGDEEKNSRVVGQARDLEQCHRRFVGCDAMGCCCWCTCCSSKRRAFDRDGRKEMEVNYPASPSRPPTGARHSSHNASASSPTTRSLDRRTIKSYSSTLAPWIMRLDGRTGVLPH